MGSKEVKKVNSQDPGILDLVAQMWSFGPLGHQGMARFYGDVFLAWAFPDIGVEKCFPDGGQGPRLYRDEYS